MLGATLTLSYRQDAVRINLLLKPAQEGSTASGRRLLEAVFGV